MKNILVLMMMLVSLYGYAKEASVGLESNEEVDVELREGNSSNKDRYPRTLISITCIYSNEMVKLTLFGEVGGYALTVTSQTTGERWSISNTPLLQTSTISGTYLVEIETEDGTCYYGTYAL